eukprot:Gb_12924 [translate_table: standard]
MVSNWWNNDPPEYTVCDDICMGVDRELSTRMILALVSWPSCCLLLVCAAKKDLNLKNSGSSPLSDSILNGDYMNGSEEGFSQEHHMMMDSNLNVTPFAKAGISNKMTFWWMNPLLSKGWKRPLEEDDLPCLSRNDRAENNYAFLTKGLRRISSVCSNNFSIGDFLQYNIKSGETRTSCNKTTVNSNQPCHNLEHIILGLQASKSFFFELMTSLFRAPMAFFDSTPLGRILSRVSSDLSILDVDLQFNFIFTISSSLNAYKLMRLNATTKSPIANHFGESISGAMTILAFKVEDQLMKKTLDLLDKNASPFFHSFAANEWLIQRLELLSAIVLSSSAIAMVVLPAGTFNPDMDVQNQCTLAKYIVFVERIKQYMHIPSEAPTVIEDSQPPTEWPSHGEVELQNLKLLLIYVLLPQSDDTIHKLSILQFLFFLITIEEAKQLESNCMGLDENFSTPVRAKSLSCINQGGYKMNPFPLADLAELLMMKEPDMENFCTLCGLLTSTNDRGVKFLMVKQVNFSLPQKEFPQYNCPLISRK